MLLLRATVERLGFYIPGEQAHTVERNKCYTLSDLLARLERATTGNYTGYYDIDCHNHAMIISSEPLFAHNATTLTTYLTPGNARLTLEDGTPIDAKENDWLVPLVIRKEGFENIHLLLPSNLIGELKAGDTLKLKYKKQVFTITIANDDPQYHDYQNGHYRGSFKDHVKNTEYQLYTSSEIKKPSLQRKIAGMKAHLSEVPGLIKTINENIHSTFSFNTRTIMFEQVPPSATYVLGKNDQINWDRVEIRGPNIPSVHDVQPHLNSNGFALNCETQSQLHLIMTVVKDKLIFWRNTRPLNEIDSSIPAEILSRLRYVTDEFTVLPLNENTISATQVLQNIDKVKPVGSYQWIQMKV